ncbi:MAG: SDR family NAD(P)-dependent oxidoreductase [Pseudomonadota bacterium]
MKYQSVFRPDLFAGQIIIVTGGGSGLGRCTAHELAGLGATVALVGRKIEKLSTVQEDISAAAGKASVHVCDVRDASMVSTVLAQHGGWKISAAIVFLLSEAASFITGSCMRIDGDMPNARHAWALIPHQRVKPFEGFPLATRPESQTVQDE